MHFQFQNRSEWSYLCNHGKNNNMLQQGYFESSYNEIRRSLNIKSHLACLCRILARPHWHVERKNRTINHQACQFPVQSEYAKMKLPKVRIYFTTICCIHSICRFIIFFLFYQCTLFWIKCNGFNYVIIYLDLNEVGFHQDKMDENLPG